MNVGEQVKSLDHQTIQGLVRRIVNHDDVEVFSWDATPISFYALNRTTGGIHRMNISGEANGKSESWSIVLKIALKNDEHPDPSYWNFWKREFLAYQSGFFKEMSGGLVAPRCYDLWERPNGDGWIWLEDIQETTGAKWPLSRYGLAAYHFGEFQGPYLTKEPLPSYPWLGDSWLRRMIKGDAWSNRMDPDRAGNAWELPIVRDSLSRELADEIMQLWADPDLYLDSLEQLPQTVCHSDAHRRNLMARGTANGQDQTVAIDWHSSDVGRSGRIWAI